MIAPEFCPVTDLSDARCRQYDDAQCSRGGFCNFIHWKHVPKAVKKRLFRRMYADHPEYSRDGDEKRQRKEERKSRRRSRSRSRRRDRSEDRRTRIDQWNKDSIVDESQL
jgi:splicing factor U2AF subunit